jgi:hypothetical protein
LPANFTAANPARSGLDVSSAGIRFRKELAVGVCLFLLLAYCTATIFVRAAWPLQSFQIGIFALLVVYLIAGFRMGKECTAKGVAPLLVYFIPVWGVIQILAHTTASTIETREAVLRWGALVSPRRLWSASRTRRRKPSPPAKRSTRSGIRVLA